MTSLKCSAHNCCYNKNSRCSRGSISVEGADARYADDTACESFRDQEECAVKNSADPCCGCETINIDCKAHNCTYKMCIRDRNGSPRNAQAANTAGGASAALNAAFRKCEQCVRHDTIKFSAESRRG